MSEALLDEPTRPLRRCEYDRLVEEGMFDGERIELLEGRLVVMSPQKPRHALPVQLLTDLLVRALGDRAYVRVQLPLAVSDLSEPEPDIAVVARTVDPTDHPTSAFLVIEVADSSLRKDREVKAALYALADIEEYWIVDVVRDTLIVHREPAGGDYGQVTTHGRGDTLTLAHFPDVTLDLDEFLRRT